MTNESCAPECVKVYCGDHGRNNNDALIASILNNHRNNDNDLLPAMMMGGGMGMNNWMNNPFAYMMFMSMMRWMGWNGDGNWNNQGNVQGIELQNQIQSLRTQMQDNQNSSLITEAVTSTGQRSEAALMQLSTNLNMSYQSLKDCCCAVQSAIQAVAGQVGTSREAIINAANMGDCRVIEAIKDCCCQNKELVQRMGYETQLGLKDVNYNTAMGFKDLGFSTREGFCGMSREMQFGFDRTNTAIERAASSLGFEAERNKCDIVNAINAAQQRNADMMQNHWSQEQQLKINRLESELDNRDQTDAIIARLTGQNCGCRRSCGCNGNYGQSRF